MNGREMDDAIYAIGKLLLQLKHLTMNLELLEEEE